MKKIVALLFIALAFSACHKTSPYDTVIPRAEAALEMELLSVTWRLSVPDQELLAAYLARVKKGANSGQTGVPPDMTIGGAIAEQKKFNAEELKKKAEKERAEKLRKPGDAIGIKVSNIKVVSDKELPAYQRLQCQLVVENYGKRDISGIKGRVYFYDGSGREMAELALHIKKNLKAYSVTSMAWQQDYNAYSEEDRALAKLTANDYKTVFIPEMIVFANGKKLILPE